MISPCPEAIIPSHWPPLTCRPPYYMPQTCGQRKCFRRRILAICWQCTFSFCQVYPKRLHLIHMKPF